MTLIYTIGIQLLGGEPLPYPDLNHDINHDLDHGLDNELDLDHAPDLTHAPDHFLFVLDDITNR